MIIAIVDGLMCTVVNDYINSHPHVQDNSRQLLTATEAADFASKVLDYARAEMTGEHTTSALYDLLTRDALLILGMHFAIASQDNDLLRGCQVEHWPAFLNMRRSKYVHSAADDILLGASLNDTYKPMLESLALQNRSGDPYHANTADLGQVHHDKKDWYSSA